LRYYFQTTEFLGRAIPLPSGGGNTPVESMPSALQTIVQIFPSTHYVNFAQAILYRDTGIEIVWRSFAAITVI
jgi:ABC-2 type transport system permease protein